MDRRPVLLQRGTHPKNGALLYTIIFYEGVYEILKAKGTETKK